MGSSQTSDLGATGNSAPPSRVIEHSVAGGCGLGWWNEVTYCSFVNFYLSFKILRVHLNSQALYGLCTGYLLHPGCTMIWFGYAIELALV